MPRTKEQAKVLQEELRLRELKVVEEQRMLYGTRSVEQNFAAITADRLERWVDVVAGIKIPEEITKWAARMTSVYGPQVMMHDRRPLPGYKTDWIIALLIVLYGESEYYWPEELGKFAQERTRTWITGKKIPSMISYLSTEG